MNLIQFMDLLIMIANIIYIALNEGIYSCQTRKSEFTYQKYMIDQILARKKLPF